MAYTYMSQSVNRRVYQRISNNDIDIRGEISHFMQQSEFQRHSKSLKFTYSYLHMKHEIIPSSLLLK